MGVPFSQEIKTALDLAADLKPYAIYTLYTIIFITVLNTILLGVLVVAVIGLLISVNPDLAEERKTIVTPILKWWLLPMLGWRNVFAKRTETAAGERRRGEGMMDGNESVRGQRRRKASPR
ncbi:hypothetical protein EG329_013478 [Mollisiaceae sp. DMI_Dod_QoI]|nr:hypothetical protein EG329_013478 [Helotiales sp. DMI_Dod_QoI]